MRILKEEFKHSDHRRTLKQIVTADLKQVNFYEVQKGSTLGDHYHKETYEYFLITKGTITLDIRKKDSYDNQIKVFNRGQAFVVEPGEIHTINCMTDASFVTFLTKPYTKEDTDTYV